MNSSPLIIVITASHERVLYENYPSPMRVCCLCKPVTHSKLAGSLASIFNTKPPSSSSLLSSSELVKIPASPKFNPSFPNFGNNIGNLDLRTSNNSNNNNISSGARSPTYNQQPQLHITTSNYHSNQNNNNNNNNINNNERTSGPRNTRRADYTLLIHTLVVEGTNPLFFFFFFFFFCLSFSLTYFYRQRSECESDNA
jgi:hypothetical protein